MIESTAVDFEYKGEPAKMAVLRNNGYCWGRIYQGKECLDVTIRKDWYDYSDEDAAQAFIRAARRESNVEPAAGWRTNARP